MGAALAVVALTAAFAVAQSSHATTRGKNGRLVYSVEVKGHYQLFTIAPDGTGSKQVTNFSDGSDAVNPDWSPNGQRIAFGRGLPYPHAGVFTIDADGGDLQQFTPDQRNLYEDAPAYGPGGDVIAFGREVHYDENDPTPRDHTEIVVEKLDRTGAHAVTPRLPVGVQNPQFYADPDFAPDGKWITFVRIKKDQQLQGLFAVRPNGTGLHRVTPYTWDVAIKHDWSPDGKAIVLTTNADHVRPTESANLVVIRPDGSGAKQLTRFKGGTRNAYAGSFSPDGKLIAFRLEQSNKYAIAVIDRNGKNLRLITRLSSTQPRFIDWGTHP
jgi:Tol biopolymer transport system component